MVRNTGLVWHERCMWHTQPPSSGIFLARGAGQPGVHVENPETKRRLKNLLDGYGVTPNLQMVADVPVDDGMLLRFHTRDYIDRIRTMSRAMGGEAGDSTPFVAGSVAIAELAVGMCIAGARAVMAGDVDNAYVLSRPPGHHAERDRGRGFCLLGNIALAVLDLLAAKAVSRVAVIDWDVHHGNGTEQAFYDNPDVLTISLHQDQLYPLETGRLGHTGDGAGDGFNINVPLPPGSGAGAYYAAFDRVVMPAVKRFQPDLIVVACGFDASYFDPMGHMLLLSHHYAELTRRTLALADDLCEGHLLVCHEGGYSESYVPYCGVATIDAMRESASGVVDRFAGGDEYLWQALQPHQEASIDAVVAGPLARFEGVV